MATPRKTKKKLQATASSQELDSVYLIKLVMYVFIGTQWVRVVTASGQQLSLPVGLLVGVAFALHEHFRIDRKIEYAVLVVAMLVGFYAQIGLSVSI